MVSLETPLHWVGSARKDLLTFPEDVVRGFGYALGVVQAGGTPPSAKPWKGDALHSFQKKSPSGIRTAGTDVKLIRQRLQAAREDYEVRYGEKA